MPGLHARRRRRAGLLDARPRTCSPGSPAAWSAWAACRRTLVWDRQAGIHGHGGRPVGGVRRVLRPAAASAGASASRPTRRPRAPSSGCRATRRRTSSPAGAFANELDFQDQLDAWFAKVNARTHKTLRARPVDRLADELEVMAPLPDADARHRAALGDAGPARPAPAPRHQRLLASIRRWSAAASRSSSTSAPSPRSRWTPARSPAATRASSPGTGRSPRSSTPARCSAGRRRSRGDAGRGPAAGPLRRADRMTRATTELAHLFRQLKAPAAARALPKLADRARAEEWSYRAVRRRAAEDRDRQPRQPRRPGPDQGRPVPRAQDARGVRLRLPDQPAARDGPAPRPARLPRRQARTSSCSARPAPARRTWRSRSGSAPAWPATASRSAPRPNGSRCSPTPNATAAWTTSSPGCNASRC